jgi:hypothetical protein
MNDRRRGSRGGGSPPVLVGPSTPAPRAAPSDAPTVRPPVYAPLRSIPVPAMGAAELRGQPLDNLAGFLLSLMDGVTNVEMLLDVCAMPTELALRLLDELVRTGVVELRDGVPTRRIAR